MKRQCLAILLAVALTVPLAAQEGGSAIVHMADGSSVPLVSWTLSYEYLAWRQGTPQFQSSPQRRDSADIWLGKRIHPVKGQVLEIVYTPTEKERQIDGVISRTKVPVATGLVLSAAGKKTPLKIEAPHRDLIIPGAEKALLLAVRTLDLKGQTLTGTRRELCLISFTTLVQCAEDPANQVARIEFQ
jgi:hypothetical protein